MMIGGTFVPGEEKIRPGFYTLFEAAAKERTLVGERGIAALPLELSWGESKTFIEISRDKDVEEKLGLDINDPSLFLLKEARKVAKTVLLYRVNEGTKATATLPTETESNVTVTALFGGRKGNEITIQVNTNVLEDNKKDVTTFDGTRAIDKQTISDASELVNNSLVTFTGSGNLANTAGTKLENGEDNSATNLDYMDFLEAAETEYFDAIGLPVDDDEQLKTAFSSFVKRVRDEQGVYFSGILPNYPGDHEGITNVANGVEVDGRVLTPAEAVAWATGASASATLYQSLTFVEYEGATDVSPRFDSDEIKERLQKGEFIFTYDAREKVVSVEQDINSLVSFTDKKDEKFRKNKIIRILDGIANDLKREARHVIRELKAKGQDLNANDDGKQILSSLYAVYLNVLQENGAIKNFDASNDIIIEETDAGDGFFSEIYIQPVDSAEKIYNHFIVA